MPDAPVMTTTAPAAPQNQNTAPPVAPAAPVNGAQPGDVAAAAKEAIRKLKYKTKDGREEEVDESEALKVYQERKQHQSAASRELNEGRAARKQAEEVIAMLKDGEKIQDILVKLGHDPRKLSEKILARHLEDELMDPRDKELRETKARLQQLEDMDKKQKEAIAQKRRDELKTKYMKEYESDFVKALEESKLPPTKPMVAEMAKYIARAAKIGFELSPNEAAQMVREDIQTAHQRLIGDADGDTLLKLLGDDVANKIRQYDTSKLKDPAANLLTPKNQTLEPRERRNNAKKKPMSVREWQLHKRGLK